MNTTIPKGKILVGQYEISDFLGRGGFGETYHAIDKLKLNAHCVIKRLRPKKTDEDTLKAARILFKREAQFLYKLGNHNQIPRLLGDFEDNEEFYLAQEFIEGEDFKKELEKVKKLNEPQVITLLTDVLEVLKVVHQHNVIHRDIKPSNLIRRQSDGKFVLIDFGSVKQISTADTSSDGLTSSTIAVGTRGYMPHEQQGGNPRPCSDIYALGMTAIHALTGKSPIELVEDSRTGEVIWRQYATASSGLMAILDKMIKSHPIHRYKNVDEVLKDLHKLQNPWESAVSKVSSFTSVISKNKLSSLRFFNFKYVLVILASIGVIIAAPRIYAELNRTIPTITENNSPKGAEQYYQEGTELANKNEYQEAIAAYDKALKSNPNNAADIWKSRATALFNLEKYEDALSSLDKALAINANDITTLNNKAYVMIQLDRYDEAITISNKALTIDANSTFALVNRSRALGEQKKYEEALKDIDKALAIDANNYSAWRIKGDILHFGLNKQEEAIAAYDKATSIEPKLPATWINRGDALYQLKRYSEAVYSYDESIRNDPKNPTVWYQKARALYRQNKHDEAIAAIEESLKYQPDDPDTWYGKGQILVEQQKYQEALAAYNKALELKPDYQEAKEAKKKVTEKLAPK